MNIKFFKNISFKEDKDERFVVVNRSDAEQIIKEESLKEKQEKRKETKQDSKQTKGTSKIQKTTKQKQNKFKNHSSSGFGDISFLNIVLTVVPTLVMVMYVILAFTGTIKDIHFSVGFEPTLFGYNFELSGLALNWFESTKHGFFSAITLGLLQIILILLGFLLDLVIHLIFLLIAVLILILMALLSLGFLYVFPAAIVIWLIIYLIKVDLEVKKFALIFLLLSLAGCITYYVTIFNMVA